MNNKTIHVAGSATPIDPATLTVPGHSRFSTAAVEWFEFGLDVIPILPETKATALKWDPWLEGLSSDKIRTHWKQHPNNELGFIVGDDIVVMDADSPQSIAALSQIEEDFDVVPNFVVKTRKGQHHYFRLAGGTFAKTNSHSTELFPERIDVKARRSMVILPPSTGKETFICDAEGLDDLVVVGQDFIDAVFKHNGSEAPCPTGVPELVAFPTEVSSQEMVNIKAMLTCLNPDCGYEDWIHVGMAIKYETRGSDEGFALWNAWSSKGKKYPGERELRAQWGTFKTELANPITVATIRMMVKGNGHDWMEVCSAEEQFKPCETIVVEPSMAALQRQERKPNLLDRYSLKGWSQELEKQTVEQVLILGKLVLKGQSTVFYAAPNTGKTLITLSLIIEGIAKRHIDPDKLYYLNVDDSGPGLVEKVKLAEEYGFHMLADGHQDFKTSAFLGDVTDMIKSDQCREVIIILDTLKKFTSLMDKQKVTEFTKLIRQFIVKGGTLLALAHTNKHPGPNGKPVYAGTTDVLEDFDCGYTLAAVATDDATKEKVVEFENIKRRGNVALNAAYGYSSEVGISYNELLLTVRPVDFEDVSNMKHVEQLKSDAEVVGTVVVCIKEGINTKMLLAKAVAAKTGISGRSALKIIEKYTGTDPAIHRWSFVVRARGAQMFQLLEPH